MQPSRVGRRYSSVSSRGGRKLKRSHKTAVRTIVCLPLQLLPGYTSNRTLSNDFKIPFPRGKIKEKLHQCGLIAKVNFVTSWNSEETTTEIGNLFGLTFHSSLSDSAQTFGYVYLATYPGLRSLTKPKVNKRFVWDAKAVLSLHRTTIHILSNTEHEAFNEKKENISLELLEVRLFRFIVYLLFLRSDSESGQTNDLNDWYSQLPCLTFSIKGIVWRKPTSLLVVPSGKALNGISPILLW